MGQQRAFANSNLINGQWFMSVSQSVIDVNLLLLDSLSFLLGVLRAVALFLPMENTVNYLR